MEKAKLKALLEDFLNSEGTDLQKLIQAWKNTLSGSDIEAKIEERIAKVVKEETDFQKLIQAWKNTPSGSDLEAKIEERIAEVVKGVTLKDVPVWFGKQLKSPSFPRWVSRQIRQQAKELLSQMED